MGVHGGYGGQAWLPLPLGKGAARLPPCITQDQYTSQPLHAYQCTSLVPELNYQSPMPEARKSKSIQCVIIHLHKYVTKWLAAIWKVIFLVLIWFGQIFCQTHARKLQYVTPTHRPHVCLIAFFPQVFFSQIRHMRCHPSIPPSPRWSGLATIHPETWQGLSTRHHPGTLHHLSQTHPNFYQYLPLPH